MTEQEAIKALRLEGELEIEGNARRVAEFFDGLDVATNSLQKQIPQKISKEGYCGFVDYICPVCGNDIDLNKKYNYCSNCGQRLEK